jgi:hypothetical protein
MRPISWHGCTQNKSEYLGGRYFPGDEKNHGFPQGLAAMSSWFHLLQCGEPNALIQGHAAQKPKNLQATSILD